MAKTAGAFNNQQVVDILLLSELSMILLLGLHHHGMKFR